MSKPIINEPEGVIRLMLPLVLFEDMHAALDKKRSTSKTITVHAESLRSLLSDHSACLNALKGRTREPV